MTEARKLFRFTIIFGLTLILSQTGCSQNDKRDMNYNKLNPEEERVIVHKGTEMPFTGKYLKNKEQGIYTCKRCDQPLFRSSDKFESNCGWPSFDGEIPGAITRVPDSDGMRTEITCKNCGAHLGHVFEGEGFTIKDTRHCVNSVSLNFTPESTMDTAVIASGCFWGTEYYMGKAKGVISTKVGYTGGKVKNPTYKEVCSGLTGHAEAVMVVFDKNKTSFRELAILFFETHDPTQVNRQGPDIGEQYRSAIFYMDENQKQVSQELINILNGKGYKIATQLTPFTEFWEAENYHQGYYKKTGDSPYCHFYTKRF